MPEIVGAGAERKAGSKKPGGIRRLQHLALPAVGSASYRSKGLGEFFGKGAMGALIARILAFMFLAATFAARSGGNDMRNRASRIRDAARTGVREHRLNRTAVRRAGLS